MYIILLILAEIKLEYYQQYNIIHGQIRDRTDWSCISADELSNSINAKSYTVVNNPFTGVAKGIKSIKCKTYTQQRNIHDIMKTILHMPVAYPTH